MTGELEAAGWATLPKEPPLGGVCWGSPRPAPVADTTGFLLNPQSPVSFLRAACFSQACWNPEAAACLCPGTQLHVVTGWGSRESPVPGG